MLLRIVALFVLVFASPVRAYAQEAEDPNFDYLEPDIGLLSTWSRIQESLFRRAAHPGSYNEAKRLLYNQLDDSASLYCGCTLDLRARTFDATDCGYVPRNDNDRAKRVEVEHVVPAFWLDKFHTGPTCWIKADACGSARECCLANDARFRDAHNDLVNLYPAIGELNGDRSNLPYGQIDGEARVYGQCDFEIDANLDLAEPRDDVRGDIARVYFYMSAAYGLTFPADLKAMLDEWNASDPVSPSEVTRNDNIRAVQGHANDLVSK
ncbi:endonuclease [Sinorhizobium glycinis]|uniref:endonuclease n=1 Tax=Sinorhizobium glycinis TaxID=1472378 RepID=UPI000A916554|nr:endonuclease [Sinorhizobium glycinis]